MLDTDSYFDADDGPKMVGPDNTQYGRELSQVETRAIDTASIDYVRQLLRQDSRHAAIRILDLGCGSGHNAERFARMGCHVTAVDVRHSQEDIKLRNRRLMQDGLPTIDFINQNITTIDFTTLSDAPWDVVFLNRVLHFVPEICLERIIQSVVDVSAPNTHFVINFRSSDYKTPHSEGRTFIESDEDGCLPTYYLHNAQRFMTMLHRLGCSVALHEKHDRLCLLFVKNSPAQPAAALAPSHPNRYAMTSGKPLRPQLIYSS